MPEYTVDLAAQVGRPAASPDLGEQFLTALERRPGVLAPAVSQDTVAGKVAATFTVEAQDAWVAATRGVEEFRAALKALGLDGPMVEVRVSEDDTEEVTGAEIARRLGVTRERVRQWAQGKQYGFPPALRRVGSAKVWRWGDVRRWAVEHGKIGSGQ